MPGKPNTTYQYPDKCYVDLICPSCGKPFRRLHWELKRIKTNIRPTCSNPCFSIELSYQKRLKYATTGTKRCPRCKADKPLKDFPRSSTAKTASGRYAFCRACHSVNGKRGQPKENAARAKLKAALVLQMGNKCARCGVVNLPICAFQSHHKDEQTKSFAISAALAHGKRKVLNAQKEIAKCELICANCHSALHTRHSNKPATEYQLTIKHPTDVSAVAAALP